jgi:hypothetical protein
MENGQAVEILGRARILFLHVRNPLFEELVFKVKVSKNYKLQVQLLDCYRRILKTPNRLIIQKNLIAYRI